MKPENNYKLDLTPKTELTVNCEDVHCRVTRIDDETYYKLARERIAIEPDYVFLMELNYSNFNENVKFNIARFYTIFKLTYGESGQSYDDWKETFNFHFKVGVLKGDIVIPYLLKVIDHRGGIEFLYYKIIQPEDTRFKRGVIHPALDDEFSNKQMNRLSAYLFGFAEGFCEGACLLDIESFVKGIGSNHILYGYLYDDFFVMRIDDEDEFDKKWQDIKAEIAAKTSPSGQI